MSEIHDIEVPRLTLNIAEFMQRVGAGIDRQKVLDSLSLGIREFAGLEGIDGQLGIDNLIRDRVYDHSKKLREVFPYGIQIDENTLGEIASVFVMDETPAEDVVRKTIDAAIVKQVMRILTNELKKTMMSGDAAIDEREAA